MRRRKGDIGRTANDECDRGRTCHAVKRDESLGDSSVSVADSVDAELLGNTRGMKTLRRERQRGSRSGNGGGE